jgi:hypothetical protein
MKLKKIICSTLTLGLLTAGLVGCATEQAQQAKLEAKAKITKADAERIALAKVPGGTIKEGGIEKEKGKVIWSFDITTQGTQDIAEVAVDAMTGDVVAIDTETPEDEAKEKAGKKGEKEGEEKDEQK